ncbi:MAG TPA: CD1375 family protein [Clostridia bacterium]|nr:CD1375 family protein [Clostridia bacterium]
MIRWLIKKIGGVDLIDLYIALIVAGRRTIEQVPERYRELVRQDLLALGLDENGQPIK